MVIDSRSCRSQGRALKLYSLQKSRFTAADPHDPRGNSKRTPKPGSHPGGRNQFFCLRAAFIAVASASVTSARLLTTCCDGHGRGMDYCVKDYSDPSNTGCSFCPTGLACFTQIMQTLYAGTQPTYLACDRGTPRVASADEQDLERTPRSPVKSFGERRRWRPCEVRISKKVPLCRWKMGGYTGLRLHRWDLWSAGADLARGSGSGQAEVKFCRA